MKNIIDRNFWLIVFGLFVFELLSWLVFVSDNSVKQIFLMLLFVVFFSLSLKSLRLGLLLALLELVVGGLGYWFFADYFGQRISLRLVLFVAIMSASMVFVFNNVLKKRQNNQNIFHSLKLKIINQQKLLWLIPLCFSLLLAGGLGLYYQRPVLGIFNDANGYLYWLILIPVLLVGVKFENVVKIILSGSLFLSLKTIWSLLFFARGWAILHDVYYNFLRDTRIGEISLITEPLYRIFFQSHIYCLLAIIIILSILFFNTFVSNRQKIFLIILLWLNLLALLISQSRTFWLVGLGSLVLFIFGVVIVVGLKTKKQLIYLVVGLPLLLLLAHFSLNLIIGDFQINLFYSRLNEGNAEAGVSSRGAQIMPALEAIKQQPIWGWGFNKTITYQSSDPRIKNENNPDGWYTTDALELGYLDWLLKFGLMGFLAQLLAIFFILSLAWRLFKEDKKNYWLIMSVIILCMIHALTPYLNHPLGIGWLLIGVCGVYIGYRLDKPQLT